MKINTQTLTKSLSIQDLASIVHADAADTYSKYAEAFSNLSCLSLLEDIDNRVIAQSEEIGSIFDNLYDYILNECENQLTLVMNDGDILWLETYEDIDPHEPERIIKWIRSVHKVYESEDHSQYYTEEQYLCHWNENGFYLDSTVIRELSNQYDWSITEVITSIADSMNSSLLITRLTALVEEGTVTLSDVNAAVQNIPFAAGATGLALIESIKDLGTNLNSSTIMRLIQQTYKSMATTSATSTDDTIDWNDYDYSVAGYAGTVIKKAFVSAAQIVGAILLYAGAVVVKIAGAVIMAVGFVANALYQGVQYVANEFAKYDPLADTKEWPMPIWQVTFPEADTTNLLNSQGYTSGIAHNAIPFLLTNLEVSVEDGFVTKLSTPGINYYIWSNDSGQTYNVEAYLTTLFKGDMLHSYTPGSVATDRRIFLPIWDCYQISSPNYYFYNEGCFGVYSPADISDVLENDSYAISNSPVRMNQTACKAALVNTLYWTCTNILRQVMVKEKTNDYGFAYSNTGQGPISLTFTSSNIKFGTVQARPTSGTAYWEELLFGGAYADPSTVDIAAHNIIVFLTRLAPHGYVIANSYWTTTEKVINPYAINITWSDMLNYVVPSIQKFGLDILFINALCSLMDDATIEYEGDDVNFYDSFYSDVAYESAGGSIGSGMFIPSNFRNNYEFIPPSQEPGTALKIILITAAVTTALIVGVSVTRTLLKKSLRRTMAAKYSTIERMHNDYVQGGCQDTDLLISFQKAVKKYNLIARLVGYDSLSFVNGWESGDGSSAVETVNGLPQGVQDIVQSTAAEVGISKEAVIDSVHQSLSDQTEVITGVEAPDELTLKDIQQLIAG